MNIDNWANARHNGGINLPDEENSEGESSHKRMKGKSKFSREAEVIIMKEGLDNVIDAIKICSVETKKMNQKPMSDSRIWKLLSELVIQGRVTSETYLFLVENLDMLHALLGCAP